MSTTVAKPTAVDSNITENHLPRSHSPEQLGDDINSPEPSASTSNDTIVNPIDTYHTKSIPIKKSTRFGSFFSSSSSRSNSKVVIDHPVVSTDLQPSNLPPSSTPIRRRSSSGAQSFLSVDNNSTDSPLQKSPSHHKFGKSIGHLISSPASWTRKHLHHHHNHSVSEPCSPSSQVPKLAEKYGEYIKPSKKSSNKASGATNKNNIGSGATAVIRLVQTHDGSRILAVKEFIKKEKNEDEKEYLKRMHNEYCISKSVSGHANVVETMDLVVDEHDRWCTVMEYVCYNLFEENMDIFELIVKYFFLFSVTEVICLIY